MTTTVAFERVPLPDEASVAEYAVVGSCLCGNHEALSYAVRNVDEDHFVEPKNKSLFKVIKRLYSSGVNVDAVTVEGHLTAHEKKVIGLSYIIELTEKVSQALNVRHYHAIMRNRAIISQINKQYEKLRADPFNDEARKEVSQLWDKLSFQGSTVVSLKDATLKYVETIERRKAGREFKVLSGYSSIDDRVGGFYGGNLIAVGARTSLGKTSLLLNFALNFLKQNMRVLFVSAEMITDEIMDRMVSMEENIAISTLRKGTVTDDDLRNATKRLERFNELPMWFLEGGKMTMTRLRTAVDAVNPSVIFIDFIQRFVPPNPAMNRAAYFSDLANEFKALAMEKKIIVFVASQLNRDIERKDAKGRAPNLSDFKESGGIEEACDIAFLLESKKNEETPLFKKIVLHICKHRSGPTGTVPLMFWKARTKFVEEEEAPPMF